jgi:hypothetical protein
MGIEQDPLTSAAALPMGDQASERINPNVIDQRFNFSADGSPDLFLGP